MLELGKLYLCEEYHLMLYPDPETAEAATQPVPLPAAAAATAAETAYWSARLGKLVSSIENNIPLLILNREEIFYEVLAGDRKGWIIYRDWVNLKEIDYGTS